MVEPMSDERLAEIGADVRQYKGTLLTRKRPNSAIAHRAELLAEVQRLRALTAGLRQHWGAQAENSQSAFPVRTRELAEQLAAMYSRVREPGCLPTPYHVVTRYESDWQRVEAEQQSEDGERG